MKLWTVCVDLEVAADTDEEAYRIAEAAIRGLFGPDIQDGGVTCVFDPDDPDEDQEEFPE